MELPSRFLSRDQAGLIELANRGIDVFALLLAVLIITLLGFTDPLLWREWALLTVIHILATVLSFQQAALYRSWRGRPFSDQFSRLILAWAGAAITTWIIWKILVLEIVISEIHFLAWLASSLVIITGLRGMLYVTIRAFRKKGGNKKTVIIYGAGALGKSIALQVSRSPESGFFVMGFVDDNPDLSGKSLENIPVLGNGAEIATILRTSCVEELWLALPLAAAGSIPGILKLTDQTPVCIRLFPDLNGLSLLNHSASELLGFPIIDLSVNQMQGLNRLIKDAEDKILGLFLLLVSLPIQLLIGILIRLTSEGPVLFRQRRIGWDGHQFTIYKFRTMFVHNEKHGQLTQATKSDERFTSIGRWLRKTSLDELPQLVNVLQGKMSIVGPRPHAVEHDNIYQQQIRGYMRRHRVKPGITGWAQINDLRGEIRELEDMNRRLKHDLYYIEHWSLWFDLRIILATILKLFFSRNAW